MQQSVHRRELICLAFRQFQRIAALATEQEQYPIGVLTAENRDIWTDARETLINASPVNEKALERIESAIVVVALDDTKPVTREGISRAIWIGDGKSRFFDKHQRESAELAKTLRCKTDESV